MKRIPYLIISCRCYAFGVYQKWLVYFVKVDASILKINSHTIEHSEHFLILVMYVGLLQQNWI